MRSIRAAVGEPQVASAAARDAVGQIFHAHHRRLVGLAGLLVDDRGSAEEIVQDAFEELYRRWAELRDHSAAVAYLDRSVVNGSRSWVRRRVTARTYEPPHAATMASAETVMVDGHLRTELAAAIRGLPKRQREVIVLRYYLDLSEDEIARWLGISPGSVKQHAYRATETLHKRMEAWGMNALEAAIIDTLRAEAVAIEAATDSATEYDVHVARIHGVDRDARRRRIAAGVLAVAAAVVAITLGILVRGGLGAHAPSVSTPTPTPSTARFTSTVMTPRVSVIPMLGMVHADFFLASETASELGWEADVCSAACESTAAGVIIKRIATVTGADGRALPARTAAEYLAALDRLQRDGVLTLTDSTPITVGGIPGTEVTVTQHRSGDGALGCSPAPQTRCVATTTGYTDHVVVLDVDGKALIFDQWVPGTNAAADALHTQFQSMLTTVHFP